METHLATYFDWLQPWISPDLVPPDKLSQIQSIGRGLPPLSLGCLECWLTDEHSRTDLNVCINPRINEHRRVRDWPWPPPISDAHRAQRDKIRRFCRLWAEPDFFLQPLLGEIWEVYDLERPAAALPVPWFYLSFLKTGFDGDPALKAVMILKALELLESGFSSADMNAIREMLCKVPAQLRVAAFGIKPTTMGPIFRLYLELRTLDDLLGFLKHQPWPGDSDELRANLSPWTAGCHTMGATLDFTGGAFRAPVGVECHFHPEHRQEDLERFLDRLLQQGCCTPAKRDALLQWGGQLEVLVDPAYWAWPDDLIPQPDAAPELTRIRRIPLYIKMTCHPGQLPGAKAYLFFLRSVRGA